MVMRSDSDVLLTGSTQTYLWNTRSSILEKSAKCVVIPVLVCCKLLSYVVVFLLHELHQDYFNYGSLSRNFGSLAFIASLICLHLKRNVSRQTDMSVPDDRFSVISFSIGKKYSSDTHKLQFFNIIQTDRLQGFCLASMLAGVERNHRSCEAY